jgi:uncharacterized protein (DUF488 family)
MYANVTYERFHICVTNVIFPSYLILVKISRFPAAKHNFSSVLTFTLEPISHMALMEYYWFPTLSNACSTSENGVRVGAIRIQ